MTREQWIEEQLTLTVDDGGELTGKVVTTFRLEHSDGTPWGTWPAATPELAARIDATCRNLEEELPTGRHSVKLIALSSRGNPVAVLPQTVQGKSTAAKSAQADAITSARATAMNVQTAEQQLSSMAARNDVAEQRALRAEERAAQMVEAVYTMADHFQQMQTTLSRAAAEEESRVAKLEMLRELATQAQPLVGAVSVVVGDIIREKYAEHKMAQARRAAERAEQPTNGKPKEHDPS